MSSQDPSPTPTPPSAPPLNSPTNGLAARVFVSVAILAIGAWVCWVYADLLRGPEFDAPRLNSDADVIVQFLTPHMAGGAWQIQGLDWEVGVTQVKEAEFATHWRQPPQVRSDVKAELALPFEMLVQAWKPAIRNIGDHKVYEFARINSRLQLWTQPGRGTETLQAVRAGVHAGREWQLYELQPQSKTIPDPDPGLENWPPLPANVNRICRRYDLERRILGELWTFDIPLEEVVLDWENSGWRPIQPSDSSIPGLPKNTTLTNTTKTTLTQTSQIATTLHKGSRRIFVWLQQSGPGQPSLAILTRAAEISKPNRPD